MRLPSINNIAIINLDNFNLVSVVNYLLIGIALYSIATLFSSCYPIKSSLVELTQTLLSL